MVSLKSGIEKNFPSRFDAEGLLLQRKNLRTPAEKREGELLMKVECSRVAWCDAEIVTVCLWTL